MFTLSLASWALALTMAALTKAQCTGPQTAGDLRAQLLEGYDKYTRPEMAKSKEQGYDLLSSPPEVLHIQLHVVSLNGLDQKQNRYALTVWLRRTWEDYRLAYDAQSDGGCFDDNGRVGYHADFGEKIWKPDVFVENQVGKVTEKVEGYWVYPSGKVLWTSELEMDLACEMEFSQFPFDTQICGFQVGTFLEESKQVMLAFSDELEPVTQAKHIVSASLPHGGTVEWEIIDAKPLSIKDTTLADGAGSLTDESRVSIQFTLQRNAEYYSDFVIVPCVMFVAIGWASFFINRSAAPARVTMPMVAFLANTNFMASQMSVLPRLGNGVWLLQFMSISQIFTFTAIIEYTICNYLRRIEARLEGARKKARENREVETEQALEGSKRKSYPDHITKEEISKVTNKKMDRILYNTRNGDMFIKDEQVDVFFRYAYPIAYTTCCLTLHFAL